MKNFYVVLLILAVCFCVCSCAVKNAANTEGNAASTAESLESIPEPLYATTAEPSGTWEYICRSLKCEYKRGDWLSPCIMIKNVSGSDIEYYEEMAFCTIYNGDYIMPCHTYMVDNVVYDNPVILHNGATENHILPYIIIPEDAPLGEYSIKVGITGDDYGKYDAVFENVLRITE